MKAILIIRNDDDEIMFGDVSSYEYTGINIFRGTFILTPEIATRQDFLKTLIEVMREIFKERINETN